MRGSVEVNIAPLPENKNSLKKTKEFFVVPCVFSKDPEPSSG